MYGRTAKVYRAFLNTTDWSLPTRLELMWKGTIERVNVMLEDGIYEVEAAQDIRRSARAVLQSRDVLRSGLIRYVRGLGTRFPVPGSWGGINGLRWDQAQHQHWQHQHERQRALATGTRGTADELAAVPRPVRDRPYRWGRTD